MRAAWCRRARAAARSATCLESQSEGGRAAGPVCEHGVSGAVLGKRTELMPRTHLQVVLDSVADEDAVLEQIGNLLLHVLERQRGSAGAQVMLRHARDPGAIVGHALLGPHEDIEQDVAAAMSDSAYPAQAHWKLTTDTRASIDSEASGPTPTNSQSSATCLPGLHMSQLDPQAAKQRTRPLQPSKHRAAALWRLWTCSARPRARRPHPACAFARARWPWTAGSAP